MSISDDYPWLKGAVGIFEPAATIATSIAAEIPAGLYGIWETAWAGDPKQGAQGVEDLRQRYTYMPRTPEGMQNLQKVGSYMEGAMNSPKFGQFLAGVPGVLAGYEGFSVNDAVGAFQDQAGKLGPAGAAGLEGILSVIGGPGRKTREAPEIVRRVGMNVDGWHYSKSPDVLRRLDPAAYGAGAPGAEAGRLVDAPDIRDRSFFYLEGYDPQPRTAGPQGYQIPPRPESGVGPGATYRAALSDLYDLDENPLNLTGSANEIERQIKELGFNGYMRNKVAIAFNPTEVEMLAGNRGQAVQALERMRGLNDEPYLVTGEVLPSTNTPIGGRLAMEPLDVRERYTDEVAGILDNERVLRSLGIDTFAVKPGYGTYQGKVNPNLIFGVNSPEEAKAIADTLGYTTRQDAVPYLTRQGDGPLGITAKTQGGQDPGILSDLYEEAGLDATRTSLDRIDAVNFDGIPDDEFAGKMRGFFRDEADLNYYQAGGDYNETRQLWETPEGIEALPAGDRERLRRLGADIESYGEEFLNKHGTVDPGIISATASNFTGSPGKNRGGRLISFQPSPEGVLAEQPLLGLPDPKTASGPLKATINRAIAPLRKPGVRARENMRHGGETVIDESARAEGRLIMPEDILGNVLVPVPGDRSRAGGQLQQVRGVPLRGALELEGGPGFSEQHAGTGAAWASMHSAASSKQRNITKAAEETGADPVGVYVAMSPEGTNFSHHVAEGMLRQVPNLDISKSAKKRFDNFVRNKAVPGQRIPDWVGIDSDYAIDQILGRGGFPMEGSGELRKRLVNAMGSAQFRNEGFPSYVDTLQAVNDPRLAGRGVGSSGLVMFEGSPGAPLIRETGHSSYSHDIPGEYLGGLAEPVPLEVMFPKTVGRLADEGTQNIPRSIQMRHHYELADEEWLQGIMDYYRRLGLQ